MSAFMVDPFHINAMVTFAASPEGLGAVRPGEEQAVATRLWEANRASIRAKYGAAEAFGIWGVIRYAGTRLLEPGEFLSACECFDYQACEVDGWEHQPVAKLVAGWVEELRRRFPGVRKDPEVWELLPASVAVVVVEADRRRLPGGTEGRV